MNEIFRDGDWRLISGNLNTEVQHLCNQPYSGKPWWYYAYDGQCGVCHEEIPEPILGLRNLHRWDR